MLAHKRFVCVLFVTALLGMWFPATGLIAQGDSVMLSVALTEYMGGNPPADTFTRFEADPPGLKVNVVKVGQDGFFPPAAYDANKYFDGVAKYASTADVLEVNAYTLAVEGTR